MRRRSLGSSFGEEETESMVTTNGAPEGEGFGPSVRISPLIELLGPFYFQGTGTDLILGLRVCGEAYKRPWLRVRMGATHPGRCSSRIRCRELRGPSRTSF
jgi:hypothetical protein